MNTILRPYTPCAHCEALLIPVEERHLLVLGDQIICGFCGNSVAQQTHVELPAQVVRVVRSLLQHGMFHIAGDVHAVKTESKDQKSDTYTLQLMRSNAQGSQICQVQWSVREKNHRKEGTEKNKYTRDKISCFVPESVHKAAVLISDSDYGGWNSMNFIQADVSADRKTIRFEWWATVYTGRNVTSSSETLLVRVELAWICQGLESSRLFVAVADEVRALKLLSPESWSDDAIDGLSVCLTRELALKELTQGGYILGVSGNPYALGAAVLDDVLALRPASEAQLTMADVFNVAFEMQPHKIGPAFRRFVTSASPILQLERVAQK